MQIYPGFTLGYEFLWYPRILEVTLSRFFISWMRYENSHLLRPPEYLAQLGDFHISSQLNDEKTDDTFLLAQRDCHSPEGKRVLCKEERVRGRITLGQARGWYLWVGLLEGRGRFRRTGCRIERGSFNIKREFAQDTLNTLCASVGDTGIQSLSQFLCHSIPGCSDLLSM